MVDIMEQFFYFFLNYIKYKLEIKTDLSLTF